MAGQGYVLDIDTQFLERLKRADEELKKIVGSVDNVTGAFKTMLNTAGGINNNIFSNIISQVEKIGKTKVTANVDIDQLERMMSTLTEISSIMGTMSKGGKELFDLGSLGNMNASLVETENKLKAIEKRITELKKEYNDAGFKEPINDRTGKPYGRNTKTYKAAKEAYMSSAEAQATRNEIDAKLRAEIEKKAILDRELKFAKMTQDEKAAYVQKKVAEILEAEKRTAADIQKEYSATVSKMVTIGGQYDRASKKNSDGSLDQELSKLAFRFEELNAKRMEMERTYGEYVVSVASDANAKIANLEIKRILDRQEAERKAAAEALQTPAGALRAADSASTINEMREAMANLQAARDNVHKSDTATIDKLNSKYIELRATVEALTTAEKNENSLQPSIRNEYERLHRELEKVNEAKAKAGSLPYSTQNTANYSALEAREKDLQARIAEIRRAAGAEMDSTDRKIAADRAAREVELAIQTEARKKAEIISQYQEALRVKEELDKIHTKMTKETLASGGRTPSQADQAEIARQRAEVNARIESIEKNHSDKIKDIIDKRNRDRIKAELDANREQVALTSRMQAQIRSIVSKAQKGDAWDTFKDSINPFKRGKMVDTKSIEEAVAAIDRLKAARERLSKAEMGDSSGRYQRGINRISEEIRRQEAYVERLRGAHRRLAQDAENLKNILGRVFGLAALKGYASQLLRVRGEFEMAQKSLEVLLRNKGEADLLWQRTVDLAVKSPYTTQQLVTATKQLAAYRVESHKLYSTTKMLTDISAGLGVEINRLVLAYGQVKAANFLRGTELRQFSEAGVNLLDELAQRFTEIEGKTVTVQQVFDRISKRMVSFADVEAVLQKITSSGGAFYNMQEQQSETLKGQMLNLKDSVELMFNEMGKEADGVIKKIISGLKWMIDHWRQVGIVVGPVLTAFLGMRVVVGIINGIRTAILALNKAIMANPILFWIGVATTVISTIVSLVSSAESISEEFTSQLTVFENNTMMMNGYAQATVNLTNRINELEKIENKTVEQERELAKVMATRSSAINELIGLNEEYGRSMMNAGNDASKMNALMQEEQRRQLTTRNFLVNLEDVNISGLDKANASLAVAEAKLAAIANMDLSKGPKAFTRAVKESGGDIEKFKKLYETYLHDLEGWGKDNAKSQSENIFTQMMDYELGNDKAEEFWNDIKESYVTSLESSGIEATLSEAIRLSFDRAHKEGIIAGLAHGEDSDEYQEAIVQLRSQYYHMVEQAGESIGPNGAAVLEEELARMFGLTADWLYKTEPIALKDWMIPYNKALEGFVEKNSALYKLLAATEQDTVPKRISAIRQEKAEKEALIAANLALIASSTNPEEKAALQSSVDETEAYVAAMTKALALLGSIDKGSGQDKWEKSVKTLNDVYNAYSKLSAKFGEDTATMKLWEQWGKVVDENLKAIGFSAKRVREQFGDLNTQESIEKALDYLSKNGSTKGKKAALELLAEIKLDYEIKERDKQQERLKREVERMFSGYELSLEIAEMNIPQDFAGKFFDMDILSLDELRKQLFAKKNEFIGEEGVEEYNEFLRKLNEMEANAQRDRLKKYLEFTKQSYSDLGQILVEATYKINDINEAFKMTNTMAFSEGIISDDLLNRLNEAGKSIASISESELKTVWGLTDTQIEKWRELTALLEAQREMSIDKAIEEKNKKIQETSWKSFKETEVFAEVFSDLEDASDSLMRVTLERLNEFKEAWADLDMKEFSEIIEMIKKLEDELAASTPFRTLRESTRDIKKAMDDEGAYKVGTFESKEAQELLKRVKGPVTMKDYDAYTEALQAELAYRENIVAEQEMSLALAESAYNEVIQTANATDEQKNNAKALVDTEKNNLDLAKAHRDVVTQTLSRDNQRRVALEAVGAKMSYALDQANKLYDAFSKVAAALGEDDSMAAIFVDMGMQMLNTVMNTIMLQIQLKAATLAAIEMGVAMKSASGIIGWIVMAVELIATSLASIFQAQEKKRQEQVDAETRRIKKIQHEYEDLEKALDKVYDVSRLNSLTKAMNDKLYEEQQATKKLIDLENEAKDPDEDKIADLEREVAALEERMAENLLNKFSTATDGVLDSTLDAARGFVDAWYDAYKEAGEGLEGLNENFNDMFDNILKQQASLTLIGPMVDEFKERVRGYVGDDSILGEHEAMELRSLWDEMAPKMNESLKSYFGVFDDILSVDYGELSGLEKGIKGMTEDQAEILASYWNSCRFLLSNIDTTLTGIAERVLGGGTSTNSTEAAIREQTAVITEIREMLRSVIGNGGKSTHSMSYLRVNDA